MKHKLIKILAVILIVSVITYVPCITIKAKTEKNDISSSNKTPSGLVSFCYEALNDGCGYVWGGSGELCTKEFLDEQKEKYPNSDLAGIAMYKLAQKWIGKRVVDCSGLIRYYLTTDKYGNDPVYDEELHCSYIQDLSPLCGDIKYKDDGSNTMPEIPGLCVYYPGHIGVYVGNNRVIESMGTQFGVVETIFSSRDNGAKWLHWCMCPRIKYKAKILCNKDKHGKPIDKREKRDPHEILKISPNGKSVNLKLSNKKDAWVDIADIKLY